jgi:hypothetical protein
LKANLDRDHDLGGAPQAAYSGRVAVHPSWHQGTRGPTKKRRAHEASVPRAAGGEPSIASQMDKLMAALKAVQVRAGRSLWGGRGSAWS